MNSIFDEIRAGIHSVWNRRWLALAVAWGICLVGWLALAMVPNTYESKARIFVQLDDALAEQIGIGVGDRKRAIERVRQTLTSAVNLEKVVRSTKVGQDITSPDQMQSSVARLTKDIRVVSQQDNLFEISAVSNRRALSDSENARLAQEVVQKMIDIFRDENFAGGRGEMTESLDFMNQQLAARSKELEAAEKRRLAFESQYPALAQGGAGMLQRMEANRAELRGIDADLAAAQSALAAINGQLAGTPATIAGAPGTGGARGALAQAQADLAGARARGLTDNHPDVVSLKNQIAALRGTASSESGPSGTPNPAYSSLESIKAERQANVLSLQSRRASLLSDTAQITASQSNNPELAGEAQRITRDYDVLKQGYDKLLGDREALRLRGQVETERSTVKFQVIDPPTAPRAPTAPNRPLLLAAILVAGIGAGCGGAFALSQLRGTFATTAKLESATGLPVLGSVSQVLNDAGRELRAKRAKRFVAASCALGGLFVLLLVVEFVQVRMVA